MVSKSKQKAGEKSFSNFGPITWNSLPKDLRNFKTLPVFKKNLKTFLFRHHFV